MSSELGDQSRLAGERCMYVLIYDIINDIPNVFCLLNSAVVIKLHC
jgi:hypothetical protein